MTMTKEEKEEIVEVVKQSVQSSAQGVAAQAAEQAATQAAMQVAEQIGQAVSQAISKVLQSFTQTTGASTIASSVSDRIGDIGGTERLEKDQMNDSGLLFANSKRTYDEYQHESLESVRRNRSYVDKVLSDAAQNDNFKQNVANQALQNAVETANMVGKTAVRHSDIAIDRQWNIDEVAGFVQKILSGIQDPAIASAMAAAIAEAMLKKTA